ncbi:MAG: TIGR03854 family LLM class F420-dependent oxidoreductase [Mycobacterium kyogaense]|uniref:TIGR03854 family LLM class F420-dependent oxidoreductase n=1 Tax=Mycobacterium kyogaense TaxID=2212479 RepID=UPI002FF5D7A9
MKVRFGVSLGTDVGPEALGEVVDRLEAQGVDSLWFSELVYSPAIDPTVGMAVALARTRHLKVGTSVAVLPGRHPVLVAKALLSMATLAPKRVLPVFGLRSALPVERDLFVVPDGKRGAVFDESLTLLRRVLREDAVTFTGEFFSVRDATINPKPAAPLDVWLGGSSSAGYRRIGTHADGWLGSFLTPEETRGALVEIRAAAEKAGRHIPDDHFGINVAVGTGDLPDAVRAAVHARRPDLDPAELVAPDWPALHAMLDGYIAAGLTKFVIRPLGSASTAEFLDRFVEELLPRQN